MRFTVITTILLALASPGHLRGAEEAGAASDAAAQWVSVLQDAASAPKERTRARVALRAMAAGGLDDPDTRLAVFALAREALKDSPPMDAEAIRTVSAATTLFPDDPRTPPLLRQLAEAHLATDDSFGAHLVFTQLLRENPGEQEPALLALAAETAARIGDSSSAHEWSSLVDPSALEPPQSTRVDLARLKSAESLGRFDLALESIRRLEATDPDALRLDETALLAAARVREATGLLDDAAASYEIFVNVFATSEHRPEALFALTRVLERSGRNGEAEVFLNWLTEEHPDSELAGRARLKVLELDGQAVRLSQVDSYLDLIREARGAGFGGAAADHFADRMLAGGLPVELMASLGRLATEPGGADALYQLIALDTLERYLEPVLTLLSSRDDLVSVAAVAEQAAALDIGIPRSQQKTVMRARQRLGLPPAIRGPLEQALDEARATMQTKSWDEAATKIDMALRSVRSPFPTTVVEAVKLLATCRWMEGRDEEALSQIERGLRAYTGITDVRALFVLRGDVLFSAGSREPACRAYEQAAEGGSSRWVSLQLERCRPDDGDAKDRSAS